MIWFIAQGAYFKEGHISIKDRVLNSFLKNSRMCQTKFWFLFEKDQEDWRSDLFTPDPFLAS